MLPNEPLVLATSLDKWEAFWNNPGWDPSMRQWTRFGNPVWYHSPVGVYEKAVGKSPIAWTGYTSFVVTDTKARIDGNIPSNFDELFKLPSSDPDFSPLAPGGGDRWRWAPQQFSIDHLVDLYERGHTWAGWSALALWLSYFRSNAWPYLRNAGNEKQPYGNGSRTRTAARALKASKLIHRMLRISGAPKPWLDYVEQNVLMHMKVIAQHSPLICDPGAGPGHPKTSKFIEPWQQGLMLDAIACDKSFWPKMPPIVKAACIEIIEFAKIDDLRYDYDVAVKDDGTLFLSDEVKAKREDPKQVPTGAGSVNAWFAPFLWYSALKSSAKKEFAGKPWIYAAFFGEMP